MFHEDNSKIITSLFYNGEYQQGKQQISNLIFQDPHNSNLYANRALFLSQLDDDEQAMKDLQTTLLINPRNYIAYFNLSSIQIRINKDYEAFENLCCSLSCLYLLKSRISKRLEDVSKAIQYAGNNYEAWVLQGLILMERQQNLLAKQSFFKALQIDPSNKVIQNLKKIALKKLGIQELANDQIFNHSQTIIHRLKCSYKAPLESELLLEIHKKVQQFNQLYIEVNTKIGAVTQKVPHQSIVKQNLTSFSKNKDEKAIIINDSGLSTPKRQSELYPQPGNLFIRESILTYSQQLKKQSNFESFVSIAIINKSVMTEQLQFQSLLQQNQQQQNPAEYQSIISQKNQIQMCQLPLQQKSLQTQPQKTNENQSNGQQLINNVQQQQIQQQQIHNLIYPLDQNMKLKIEILNLQFIDKEEDWSSRLLDVYCLISYDNGKTKLKTNTVKCMNNFCIWNQQFQQVNISKQPSDMKFKLYNKKYNSIRDQYLGCLEVLITTADHLKLPLYNKIGDFLGNLLIRLQLIEVTANKDALSLNFICKDSQ